MSRPALKELLTVGEAAHALCCEDNEDGGAGTLHRLRKKGQIVGHELSYNDWRFTAVSLNAFIDRQKAAFQLKHSIKPSK